VGIAVLMMGVGVSGCMPGATIRLSVPPVMVTSKPACIMLGVGHAFQVNPGIGAMQIRHGDPRAREEKPKREQRGHRSSRGGAKGSEEDQHPTRVEQGEDGAGTEAEDQAPST
jgi:hypothetical protein